MRGKGHTNRRIHVHSGITPAYAGKSHSTRWHGNPDEDHPRLCGEKYPVLAKETGLSGITPAYAGKS